MGLLWHQHEMIVHLPLLSKCLCCVQPAVYAADGEVAVPQGVQQPAPGGGQGIWGCPGRQGAAQAAELQPQSNQVSEAPHLHNGLCRPHVKHRLLLPCMM